MRQFLGAGMLEAEHLAALRIDAGHDVLDRAVLARRVHRLKNQQQRIAVVRVEQILPLAQVLDVRGEQFLVMLVRFVKRLDLGWQLFEPNLPAFADAEFFGGDFHGRNLGRLHRLMKAESLGLRSSGENHRGSSACRICKSLIFCREKSFAVNRRRTARAGCRHGLTINMVPAQSPRHKHTGNIRHRACCSTWSITAPIIADRSSRCCGSWAQRRHSPWT